MHGEVGRRHAGARVHDRGPWASRGPATPVDGRSVGWRRRAVATDAVRGLVEMMLGPAAAAPATA